MRAEPDPADHLSGGDGRCSVDSGEDGFVNASHGAVIDHYDAASGNGAGKPNRAPSGCPYQGSDPCSQVHTSMTRIPALNRWIESPCDLGPPVQWPDPQRGKSRQG